MLIKNRQSSQNGLFEYLTSVRGPKRTGNNKLKLGITKSRLQQYITIGDNLRQIN